VDALSVQKKKLKKEKGLTCPLISSILNQFEKYYMPKGYNNI